MPQPWNLSTHFFACASIAIASALAISACNQNVENLLVNEADRTALYYNYREGVYYYGIYKGGQSKDYLNSGLKGQLRYEEKCTFLDPYLVVLKLGGNITCPGLKLIKSRNANVLDISCDGSYICKGYPNNFHLSRSTYDKRGLLELDYYPNNGAIVFKRQAVS